MRIDKSCLFDGPGLVIGEFELSISFFWLTQGTRRSGFEDVTTRGVFVREGYRHVEHNVRSFCEYWVNRRKSYRGEQKRCCVMILFLRGIDAPFFSPSPQKICFTGLQASWSKQTRNISPSPTPSLSLSMVKLQGGAFLVAGSFLALRPRVGGGARMFFPSHNDRPRSRHAYLST